ncbi:MAG: hypothetical protein AAGG57_19540 [Pseudomonadota bacterium]
MATQDHPMIAQTYHDVRDLGVTSYPTPIIWDDAGQNRVVITQPVLAVGRRYGPLRNCHGGERPVTH